MANYTIVNPGNLATGQPAHIEDVLANFQAIQAILNGGQTATYVWNQVTASASWAVAHNLGKFPAVTVVDSGGNELIPDVLYVDQNNVTIGFGSPTSGKAYFN
jgi:hypothetical protein